MFGFLKNIGPTELIIIGVVLLLFFGSKIVTGLARTSGATLKEVKNIKKTFKDAVEEDDDKPEEKGEEA